MCMTHHGRWLASQRPWCVIHIQGIDKRRSTDVPEMGLLCDLLWSDPDHTAGWHPSDRGVSYTFGADVLARFLERFELDLVVRAHQVVEDGYEFFAQRQLVTVFSAPDYLGSFSNKAAVLSLGEDLVCTFEVLPDEAPHSMASRVEGSVEGAKGNRGQRAGKTSRY